MTSAQFKLCFPDTTATMLQDAFKCCGEIDYVRTVQCKKGCNGVAFVCFKKPEAVELALKLNGTYFDGRNINVQRCSKKLKRTAEESSQNKKTKPNQLKKENASKSTKPKKKQFSGVKSNELKKKRDDKKKKMKQHRSPARKLVKKIAPKKGAKPTATNTN